MVTKNEAYTLVKLLAQDAGFDYVDDTYGKRIEDVERLVSFTISEENDFSEIGQRKITVTVKVTAAISMMGGNPTGDDLNAMGKKIIKAGKLVNMLNKQRELGLMTYEETF